MSVVLKLLLPFLTEVLFLLSFFCLFVRWKVIFGSSHEIWGIHLGRFWVREVLIKFQNWFGTYSAYFTVQHWSVCWCGTEKEVGKTSYWHWSRLYATVGCLSVCPSDCPSVTLFAPRCCCRFAAELPAGKRYRLIAPWRSAAAAPQFGAQQQMRVVARWQLAYEAEHRLAAQSSSDRCADFSLVW